MDKDMMLLRLCQKCLREQEVEAAEYEAATLRIAIKNLEQLKKVAKTQDGRGLIDGLVGVLVKQEAIRCVDSDRSVSALCRLDIEIERIKSDGK